MLTLVNVPSIKYIDVITSNWLFFHILWIIWVHFWRLSTKILSTFFFLIKMCLFSPLQQHFHTPHIPIFFLFIFWSFLSQGLFIHHPKPDLSKKHVENYFMAVDICFVIYKVVQRHIHNSLCEKPFTSIYFYMSAKWSFIRYSDICSANVYNNPHPNPNYMMPNLHI